ncbi:TetR/AcrR family transcriptional regulator [uncultured Pseudokineococcus sp.]|uniref:TetR/AcrR family transcriptional regulator n=1 Tax=uncultured Pseudokineococcus sp. TaxID=1642928 RepID=UPI002604D892|nr:TetR/AcrR family transcriptional regulator [uncultured Pseudokineococcus sp.]
MPDDRSASSAPAEAPSAAPLARPARLRADAARNRAQVLEAAAAQLAAPDGDLAMNVLARTAGVGVGTVYRHFPTRQVLLEALAADGLEALVAAAETAAADECSAGLEAVLRTGLRLQLTDAALGAVLAAQEPACVDTRALTERLESAVGQVLDRARTAGDVRDDVAPDDVRRLLYGLARAVSCGPGRLAPSARYVDVLLQGLRPHG